MKKYRNAVCKHLHQEAADLFKAGDITAERMAEFDQTCLVSGADIPSFPGRGKSLLAASAPGPSSGGLEDANRT
jgi:hypothetical protein